MRRVADLSNLRNKDIGRLFRETLRRELAKTWGPLELVGSWLTLADERKILVRYSNCASGRDSWFYDVKHKDWEKWDATNHHLAFLMRRGPECKYFILDPKESKYLLDNSKNAFDMSKKIDIRISARGRIYIIQWKDLEIANRIQKLGDSAVTVGKDHSLGSEPQRGISDIWTPRSISQEPLGWRRQSETTLKDLLKETTKPTSKSAAPPSNRNVEAQPPEGKSGVFPQSSGKPRDITRLVERSYEIEKALQLEIYGIYAQENPKGEITVNGEVRANQGLPLPKDLSIIITFHDNSGRIRHVEQVDFSSSSHLGHHVFSVQCTVPKDTEDGALAKIRVQPGARPDQPPKSLKKGLMKKIFSWIKA
jgi:hypothetical protein